MDAFFMQTDGFGHAYGGDLYTAHRSLAGSWGAASLVQSARSSFAIGAVQKIGNSTANARIVYCETTDDSVSVVPNGTLLGWARGDAGVLIK